VCGGQIQRRNSAPRLIMGNRVASQLVGWPTQALQFRISRMVTRGKEYDCIGSNIGKNSNWENIVPSSKTIIQKCEK
jgi:hypothetical protein